MRPVHVGSDGDLRFVHGGVVAQLQHEGDLEGGLQVPKKSDEGVPVDLRSTVGEARQVDDGEQDVKSSAPGDPEEGADEGAVAQIGVSDGVAGQVQALDHGRVHSLQGGVLAELVDDVLDLTELVNLEGVVLALHGHLRHDGALLLDVGVEALLHVGDELRPELVVRADSEVVVSVD